MIKTTRWRPDTCDCDLEYEWDDTLPADEVVLTIKKINKVCDAHKNLINKEAVYGQVKKENTQKNMALKAVLDDVPELRIQEINKSGEIVYRLKDEIDYRWSFDNKRELVMEFVGIDITTNVKDKIKSSLSAKNPTVKLKE